MSLARVISSWSVAVWHSSFTRSATPLTNILISSLGLDTSDGEYINNIENFKEDFSTRILPYLSLIKSSTFTSLLSWEKYFPRLTSINYSHTIRLDSISLFSFHWVYHTWAISFNFYEANSTFSVEVPPITWTVLYTPCWNSCGSSPTLEPWNIGEVIPTKSLNLDVIVLSNIFIQGARPIFTWFIKAKSKIIKASLISPLVISGEPPEHHSLHLQ